MNEFFKYLLPITGAALVIWLVGLYIGVELATKLKVIFADILKFFGWLSKGIRKKSVSSELEGTLNGMVKDFNNNFENPILPNCKIQWVTAENQKNTLIENQAIVCLSFDKRDHDLNFYNATYNFIQTALVAKAKPFLKQTTRKALDLLSTKIILRQYRRSVLQIFNKKFIEVDNETKETFHRLDETDESGLYSPFFLPEIHHFGELLFEKTPTQDIENETERFLNWFYDLATREFDERTNLRFENNHIKVGVILVAKLSTYSSQGVDAYIKWAEKYASENYTAVYLLAKGAHRHKIAKELTEILVSSKGFEQVNKKIIIKQTNADGLQVLVTCICLRPDPTTIRFNAWEFINNKFINNEPVVGIIQTVTKDNIIVNVAGLQCYIPNSDLSAANILDATKIFREDQELELNIVACDVQSEKIELNNLGTKTDPQKLIEANLSNDRPLAATVYRIQKDKENFEKGLIVNCQELDIQVFIPRSKATFSRFVDISKKYALNSPVEIILEEFNYGYGNYLGKVYDLKNPWESDILKLQNQSEVSVVIKEIQERFLICEISEGLECRLVAYEISWNEYECDTNKFNVDQTLKVKIISIDTDLRRISVSLRQFSPSPVNELFEKVKEEILEVVITSFDDDKGIIFKEKTQKIEGYIRWNELDWCNVSPIYKNFHLNQVLTVKPMQYDSGYNSILYSRKQALIHDFDKFNDKFDDRDYVEGVIRAYYSDVAAVELDYKDIIVQAYVHKSKISNCCFISNEDISAYLPIGKSFTFVVERIDTKFNNIELSRKTYLKETRDVELGMSYYVYTTKFYKGKSFFYSDDLEGFISESKPEFGPNQEIEVIPINASSDEFSLAVINN